jgi:hypothetical protein
MLHFLFIQQIYVLNILNVLHTLRFLSSKYCLFRNVTFFGSCIVHILYTGVLKFKRKFRRQRINVGKNRIACRILTFICNIASSINTKLSIILRIDKITFCIIAN